MSWKKEHDFSEGDAFLIVTKSESRFVKASVQIDADSLFDGTDTEAKFVQSNDLDLDPTLWHDLPEAPLVIPTGASSSLLSTFSHTAQYLAVVITVGDATQGIGKLSNNINFNT